MTTDWLSLVPVCDPWAYNAALICEDCAVKVCEDLDKKGVEDTGDTNDYPQEVVNGNESDSPDHCDFGARCINAIKIPGGTNKIGCPLSCRLTRDGVAYVRNSIAEHILFGSAHQKGVGRLWLHLFGSYLEDVPLIPLLKQPVPVPPVLKRALGHRVHYVVLFPQVFTDLAHVYGGGTTKDSSAAILWRLSIDSNGRLEDPRTVAVPKSEAVEREVADLVEEAISEGAWD